MKTRGRVRIAVGVIAILAAALLAAGATAQEDFAEARAALVEILRDQDIDSERVLEAMAEVPRHEFVPEGMRPYAYDNRPLPIGSGQTISQPYIVALMTQLAAIEPGERVLEIGTGSGYQAAVLAELGAEVYTIELLPELAAGAEKVLDRLGYDNVHTMVGDGYLGWPEEAPFDAVVVTAAPETVPEPLVEQLDAGGRMVIPVGPQTRFQMLKLLVKQPDGTLEERDLIPVRFVPMVQERQEH